MGYIFDFDGVLVNTMEAHFICYKQALQEAGIAIDKKNFYDNAGMSGIEQINFFADNAQIKVDAERVYKRKREIWNAGNFEFKAIRCNVNLFKILKKAGIPVAIATGSTRPSVLPIIAELGIEPDCLVTAEDVEKGKPHPDLFICAAHRLHEKPEDCIVVEDSQAGIQAAKAANMNVLLFIDSK